MTEELLHLARSAAADSRAVSDPDYPLFHLAPPVGRLNDPNGLIRVNGTYHAFFQYTPTHPEKLVFWGHATSTDLTRWEHHDPAIAPDARFDMHGAYSGTAIATPQGVELWYTGNYKDPATGEREATQCLVTSPDLVSFTKEPEPIIPAPPDGYTAHFRDPQVWQDYDSSYRMLIGAQRSDGTGAAVLYRSRDLRNWELEGEISFPQAGGAFDSFGYMWECPNLVKLVDQETGTLRDVLVFCPQGIAPTKPGFENVFSCVYVVGELMGTEFVGCDGTFTELDRGFEFYAPQVFARPLSQLPTGADPAPALLLGWAGNAGEDDQPSIASGGWVHCMTSPRELVLRGGHLFQRPFLPGLPLQAAGWGGTTLQPGAPFSVPELADSRSWRLRLEVGASAPWEIRLGGEHGVNLRFTEDSLVVDRSTSRYPASSARTVELATAPHVVEVIHDRSITEVFVDDGRTVFTLRSFLDATPGVQIDCEGELTIRAAQVARAD